MRQTPIFAAYCLLVLLGYTAARVEGWTLFASSGRAAAASGTRGGASGFHK